MKNDVAALPVHQQHLVVQLAVELRRITGELIGTARAGSATARRLSERAYRQVQKIDHCARLTETSLASLESASALTRCSNEAASIGLTMLKLFKAPARVVEAAAKADERMVTRVEVAAMQPSTSGAIADG